MVDEVGIDHVGLGSDMLGLPNGASFASYAELPELAAEMLGRGFHRDEIVKILGRNSARVFSMTAG